MAPKNAAAFDLTLARFCCAVDVVDVPLVFDGDFLCKHKKCMKIRLSLYYIRVKQIEKKNYSHES